MSEEFIYIDTTIQNKTNTNQPVDYSQTMDDKMIDRMSDYNFSVVSFQQPNNVPIMEFQDEYYYITLEYDGDLFTVPLVYQDFNQQVGSKDITTFKQWCVIMNSAFNTAYTNLKASTPASQLGAPTIAFDGVTDLFTITVPNSYIQTSPNINIYFNSNLQALFEFSLLFNVLGTRQSNKLDAQLILRPEDIVGSNCILKQEIVTIDSFYDFISVLWTTSIPCNGEYINYQNDNQTNTLQVINTFAGTINNDRSNFIYSSEKYDSRPITLTSTAALKTLTFQSYYSTKTGKIKPMILRPDEVATIKLVFYKM